MDDLLATPKTMLNWFAKPAEQTQSEANREVIEALANRPLSEPRGLQAFLCRWCLNPVVEVPKSASEYIPLRAIVMLPDAAADPPICNDCYGNVVGSFNRHATNVGTNNAGFSNLVLKNLG